MIIDHYKKEIKDDKKMIDYYITFREFLNQKKKKFKHYNEELDEPIFMGIFTFRDFICETFEPKEVDFGTDLKNKKWIKDESGVYLTFYKSDYNDYYVILFNRGHIGFGLYNHRGDLDVSSLKTLQDVNDNFIFKPRATGNALRIFNNFIYIIFNIIDKINPKFVYFSGLAEELKKLYRIMVKNKQFLNLIKQKGYYYVGYNKVPDMIKPVHIFQKI